MIYLWMISLLNENILLVFLKMEMHGYFNLFMFSIVMNTWIYFIFIEMVRF